MAETLKVLGQGQGTADATFFTLYTVPASKAAVVSVLVVANVLANTTRLFHIRVRPGGAAGAARHYVCGNVPIGVGEQIEMLRGASIAAGDVVDCAVASGFADLAFHLFGSEIDV